MVAVSAETTVIGLDLSLNGPGFVAMDCITGEVLATGYSTATKKYYFEDLDNAHYLQPKWGEAKTKNRSAEDSDMFNARRRHHTYSAIADFVREWDTDDTLVVLEDYAYDSKSTGQYELAEVSGLLRQYLWEDFIALRLHDPISVKRWATGDAYAKKMHMRKAAVDNGFILQERMYGDKGEKFKHPIHMDGKPYTHDITGPGADINDAYHLATMGRMELLVREGQKEMTELPIIQKNIFFRVTKRHPVCFLERPFIQRVDEVDNH